MIVQFLILTTFIWLLVIWWGNRHSRKLAEVMRNNLKCWPIIGHSHYFLGSDEDRMNAIQEIGKESIRCGGITSLWFMNKLVLMVSDPVEAEPILKTCLEKDDSLNVTRSLLGHGSIFAPVSIWRPRRKLLTPHFNLRRLWKFMTVHSRQSRLLVDRLKSSVGNGVFSLWDYMTSYTMDAIGETVLGTKLDAQKNNYHPFPKAFVEHSELQGARVMLPWLQNDFLYQFMPGGSVYFKHSNFMNNFVKQLIIEKRKKIYGFKNDLEESLDDNEEERPKSMLESFIESAEYTDLELHEETLVLVLAGTDTSAVGASFTISLLSRHQDVQEKLYQELKDYYGDSTRPATGDDLPHLKYLDAVTKETMRLYPPVPLITRKITQPITLPSGKTLIPGLGCYINIWALHRNERYWGPDADSFRPERFLEGELTHPGAYMPFSRGPRNCLGLQYAAISMKTVLINLLRNYKFLPPPDNQSKDLRVKFGIILKHVDNFRVQLEARN